MFLKKEGGSVSFYYLCTADKISTIGVHIYIYIYWSPQECETLKVYQPFSEDCKVENVLDRNNKLKKIIIIYEKAVAQVVRAAQGLLKGEIILDYTRVQQALGTE